MTPVFPSLGALLAARCAEHRGRLYCRFSLTGDPEGGYDDWSYERLDATARVTAGQLQALGATGARVLLVYPPGPAFLAGFLACLYAGAVAVPAYPPDPSRPGVGLSRLRQIVASAEAGFALSTQLVSGAVQAMSAAAPSDVQHALGALPWLASDTLSGEPLAQLHPARAEDLALLQYTSGSTGTPRGVMVSHGNLLHNLAAIGRGFALTRSDVGCLWLPSYHDMGLIGALTPIATGSTLMLMSPLDFLRRPLRWLHAISRTGATVAGAPDFAYGLCARKATEDDLAELDLSSWRIAFSGAEPVRASTLRAFTERFARCGFRRDAWLPVYGLAEATLMVACPTAACDPAIEPIACGQPVIDTAIRIVDPGTRELCPPGSVGEIWVAGPSVAQGYWRDPEATRACFGARLASGDGSYVRTGDLGAQHPHGLVIAGRRKDLLIVRGCNHYPQDLEATAQAAHPAIRPGCIAAFAVERDGEEHAAIAAEIALDRAPGSLDEVVRAIREAVSEAHGLAVAGVALLAPGQLPKTSSGKLQRFACRAAYLANQPAALHRSPPGPTAPSRPPGTLEAGPPGALDTIRTALARRLGCDPAALDVHAPFSRLGLGSLDIVELADELEQPLGRRLPTMALYRYPTPMLLAGFVADAAAPREPIAEPEADSGQRPVYRELDAARARIDRRGTSYRFDLERDVAWSRIAEPGALFPAALLGELGFDVDHVSQHAEAWELLQWAMAVNTCATFELLELSILLFCQREAAALGSSPSVVALYEEEDKHVQMFRRFARHLRSTRPEDSARLAALFGGTERYLQQVMDAFEHGDRAAYHYLLWLRVLVFEEYTIYLHHELARADEVIQPTWQSMHALHRREEIQHVATDVHHLRAINLDAAQRRWLSAVFVKDLLGNFALQFAVESPRRLLEDRFPGLRVWRDDPHSAARCLRGLLQQRAFSHAVREAPLLGELKDMPPAEMSVVAERACAQIPAAPVTPSNPGPELGNQPPGASHAPLAIIGIAHRLPGQASTPDWLWDLLIHKRDTITETPAERWNADAWYDAEPFSKGKLVTRWGGFLDDVAEFDPAYFGIAPREARSMDPQQRLILEATWEAIEDAGIPLDQLNGSRTSVYVAACGTDYSRRASIRSVDPWMVTGNATSVTSGRVSYLLGLRGPSMTVDTACSSALVALHLACQSLRSGESDLALVGGVNLTLIPETTLLFSELRALSPTGRCRTFDDAADGYVRSECVVAIVVKRLGDAERDGDRVLGVVRGTAVNQDGRSNGLTAPHAPAQEDVIRAALADAGVASDEVGFVEAHGTGTAVGDPIELSALDAVFRGRTRPLPIGSVKSNLGHTEGASGLVGLIKALLSVQRGVVLPGLHYQTPTTRFDWSSSPLTVATEAVAWPAGTPRIAGISAFGLGGTNAHVVIEAAAERPANEGGAATPGPAQPWLVLSTRTAAALPRLAEACAARVSRAPEIDLADACFTAAIGRTAHPHRLVIPAGDPTELVRNLTGFARDRTLTEGRAGEVLGAPKLAFLYTGQGAQYPGMTLPLYERWPAFRDALEDCAALLSGELDLPLLPLLFEPGRPAGNLIDETRYTQPAMVAVQLALTALWRSLGIEPAVVLGHSAGELAAACAAGVMCKEDALRLAVHRGRLMQAIPATGAMLSVGCDELTALEVIAPHADQVSLAVINGAQQVVLSGQAVAMQDIAAVLSRRGIQTRLLNISRASHSPLVDGILDDLETVVRSLALRSPRLPLISGLTGRLAGAEVTRPGYWSLQVRAPVRFGDGLATALGLGASALIEIGPQPVLLGLTTERSEPVLRVASVRPGMPDVILGGLAQLWSIGAPVDWRAAWAPTPRRKVALPPHPYDKQRYWLETSATAEGQPTGHPLLGARLDTAGRHTFEASLSLAEHPWLADHQVGGRVIVPATVWLEWLRAAAAAAGPAVPGASEALCDVAIERPLILEHGTGHRLQAVVDPAGRRVEIFSRTGDGWERHAAARFQPARALVPLVPDDDTRHEVAVGELYEALRAVGLAYGPGFAALERLQRGVDHALGEVAVSPSLLAEPAFPCHPAALDAALHTAAALLASEREIWLPVAFEDVIVLPSAAARWQVTARLRPGTRDERVVDVSVFEPSGRPVALFGGLALRRMASPSHRAMPHREAYAIEWAPAPADAAAAVRDRRWWLIGRGALADAVAAALPGPVLRSVERAPSDQPAGSIDAVVDLSACDEVGAGAAPALDDELGALLLRTQALLRRPPGARLWLVTRGAQLLEGDRTAPVTAAHQAARWGFGRTLAQEHPGLGCRLVDLDPDASIADAARAVLAELAVQDDLDQTAWRRAERYAAQLVRAGEPGMAMPVAPAFCLHLAQSGALDELRFAPIAQPEPGPGQVEIEVEAVGLNFRDVLNALGLTSLNGQAGGECAGRVLSVGPGVEGLAAGDPVVAFAPGALGSRVIADAVVVARRPARLGPVEVATAPVAFLTAWYGLFDLAGLRPGQRVLVHAAAGGVGMAAVQLARRAGAEVIATASAGKHDAVRALGVEHVFSSRDPGFADEIEARFGPRPVDVVLNALTGPFIPAGLRLLRPGGHFLEMGKLELWTPAQLADYPDAVYQPFELFEVAPARIAALLRELMAALDDGSLQPLPRTVFPFERASDAFRFMAQARHIGKIVLTPRPVCDPQGWYLVTGGLGGLGREVVRYLAARGARRLVVLQRRAVTDDAARFIAELAAAGIEIEPRTLDLTCPEALLRLFAERGGPPRGIVHAAAVLDDGVLGAQTPRRFAQVLAPKLHGAIALEAATRGAALDFFVMFSSIAGVVGSPGQAGYAAASAGLDGLAAAMRAQGRPSISVAYGTWAQIGLAAALGEREQRRLDAAGIRALAPALGMRYFERALVERRGHLVVADLDLPRLQRLHQPPPHWLSALLASAPVPGANAATAAADELTGIVARFAALPSDQRQAMLVDELRGVAARVLGLPRSALEPHRPLRDTGLDSLMAVEMQNALVRSLGVPLPRTLLLDHPTLDALATYLCTELSTRLGSEPRSEAPRAEPSRVDASTPELRALHDEIVELEKLV